MKYVKYPMGIYRSSHANKTIKLKWFEKICLRFALKICSEQIKTVKELEKKFAKKCFYFVTMAWILTIAFVSLVNTQIAIAAEAEQNAPKSAKVSVYDLEIICPQCEPVDFTEVLDGKGGETSIDILTSVCASRNITDDECPKILYGMAMVESRMNPNALGDNGQSLGYFQIHKGYHPGVSDECRTDLRCSAEWTLDRMIRLGYAENKDISIMSHNGTPYTTKTMNYLNKVKRFAKTF